MDEIRNQLFYQQKNGYDLIDTAERIAVENYSLEYMSFLNAARTEREAVKLAIAQAESAGFVEYKIGMELKPGTKIYRNNRGKALMLAVIGKKPLSEGCVIAGAHVDAPRIDLKQNPLFFAIGMHCLGCPSSRGETVEEACMVHGIDCDEVLANIQKYLDSKQ